MQYKQFIVRLFGYLRKHIGKLVMASIMVMLAAALEGSIPRITGKIVDDVFAVQKSQQVALAYSLIVFAVIFVSSMLTLAGTAISSWVADKVIMHIRIDMFAKLLKLPKSYFDKLPTGKIISKFSFDVEQIAAAASSIWLDLIKSSALVIFLIGSLFYSSWQLSLPLLVVLPIIYLIMQSSSKRIRIASDKVQNLMGKSAHILDENICANSLIKIYNAQNQEHNKFKKIAKNLRHQRFKVIMASSFNNFFTSILIGLILAGIIYVAAIKLNMNGGDFIAFFLSMAMLIKPAKNLVTINKSMQQAFMAGNSVFGLLDEDNENNNGTQLLAKTQGEIKFNNVCFGYDNKVQVINNINLTIKAGETIALVGHTGSGKSTIVQLLSRLYRHNSGSITIDGVDINTLELQSLRSQIAFVDQNVRLFNDTVKNNISLGQNDSMRKEQVQKAIKASNAHEFIDNMENGIHAQIGEDGVKLSGGQRQRLAIARAIAKDSPILILDEATSALDSATEKYVSQAIEAMQKNKTTIIIAHRLSTIKNADRIIVMRHGEIIEQGTHNELINHNGEYSKLYNNQFND